MIVCTPFAGRFTSDSGHQLQKPDIAVWVKRKTVMPGVGYCLHDVFSGRSLPVAALVVVHHGIVMPFFERLRDVDKDNYEQLVCPVPPFPDAPHLL